MYGRADDLFVAEKSKSLPLSSLLSSKGIGIDTQIASLVFQRCSLARAHVHELRRRGERTNFATKEICCVAVRPAAAAWP